jgi:hypothetical protein
MLAIAPADASRVTVRMDQDGSAEFMDTAFAFTRGRVHRVKVPADTFPRFAIQWTNGGPRREGVSWRPTAEAIVPTIPPDLRPPHALRGYHILWEAAWTPTPPSDPVLLKSLGGPLYAVLAQWDLTPLERAVLRGIV